MWVIRAAHEGDAALLAELYRLEGELHESLGGRFRLKADFDWAAMVRTLLAAPERRLLVAAAGSELGGFIHVHLRGGAGSTRVTWRTRLARLLRRRRGPMPADAMASAAVGVIEDCYVRPELRRQGLGAELVRRGGEWLEHGGAGRVDLVVEATNATGIAFWEQVGFRPARVIMSRPSGSTPGSPTTEGGSPRSA